MIGLKNSRHIFIQSEVKPKPIATYSHAFSRALRQRHVIGPLQDPVTWYGINYTGTQITQWDFQNQGKSGWTGASSFVLEVPLRNLRPSVIYSVPCDRIVQRAITTSFDWFTGLCVFCDWLEGLLWFWFYVTQLQTALSPPKSLHCKLVPVQCREYEYGLFNDLKLVTAYLQERHLNNYVFVNC